MPTCDMCNGDEPNHWNKVYITADQIESALEVMFPQGDLSPEIQQAIADRVADNIEKDMANFVVLAHYQLMQEEAVTTP